MVKTVDFFAGHPAPNGYFNIRMQDALFDKFERGKVHILTKTREKGGQKNTQHYIKSAKKILKTHLDNFVVVNNIFK